MQVWGLFCVKRAELKKSNWTFTAFWRLSIHVDSSVLKDWWAVRVLLGTSEGVANQKLTRLESVDNQIVGENTLILSFFPMNVTLTACYQPDSLVSRCECGWHFVLLPLFSAFSFLLSFFLHNNYVFGCLLGLLKEFKVFRPVFRCSSKICFMIFHIYEIESNRHQSVFLFQIIRAG